MDELKIKVLDAGGRTLAVSAPGDRASLLYAGCYQPGDRVLLEAGRAGLCCVVQLEDTLPPAPVYLPACTAVFEIPFGGQRAVYSPRSFEGGRHLLRARLALPEEDAARRNLAFNPYDRPGEPQLYPHAHANVETRGEAIFAARNAIDGILESGAHGEWPYQSWGIDRNPDAEWTLDFGRPVRLDELRLTLRADFPHDSWWNSALVCFSDGSSERLHLEKTGRPQRFALGPRTVDSLTLKQLVRADEASPFPALTQLEAYGTPAQPAEERN